MKMLMILQDRLSTRRNFMKVQISNEHKQNWVMEIDETKQLPMPSIQINSKSRYLTVSAEGSGFVLLDLIYSYTTPVEDFKDEFKIHIQVSQTALKSEWEMELRVCIEKNPRKNDEDENEADSFDETTTVEIEIPDK